MAAEGRLQVGIIGLGKFGMELGGALMEEGHEVLGIDADLEKVEIAHEIFTQAFQANAMDKAALEQLNVKDLDHIIVSTGNSMERSLVIALHLIEIGVEVMWVKAINEEHKKILNLIGVQHVVIPEQYAARFISQILD